MSSERKVCAVTGARGYLGSRVVRYFRDHGWDVIEVSRSSSSFKFVLGEDIASDLWKANQVHTLIHCAYDFTPIVKDEIRRINIDGSARLLTSAREGGVKRIILISSMAAFEGCKTTYGGAKLAIEHEARRRGAQIVRPGLIYGEKPGGMVGTLNRLIDLFPLVPLIGNGREVLYLVYENDLCALLLEMAQVSEVPPSIPITAANEAPMEFRAILRELARRKGRRIFFLPVPALFVWGILKFVETIGLSIGIRSDSVISLLNQDPAPSFRGLKPYPVQFRKF